GIAVVPSLRSRVLAHIPGLGGSSGTQVTGTTGELTLLVNVPTAKVTLDKQPATLKPGQNGGFATVSMAGMALGDHDLTIHADTFADITTKASIKAGPTSWIAWLAPTADALKQFSPAIQPGVGQKGDSYGSPPQQAAGALTVSISYILSGLDPKAFGS